MVSNMRCSLFFALHTRILADMAESLGQQRLTVRAERVTLVNFLEAGVRLLLDSSLEVRTYG